MRKISWTHNQQKNTICINLINKMLPIQELIHSWNQTQTLTSHFQQLAITSPFTIPGPKAYSHSAHNTVTPECKRCKTHIEIHEHLWTCLETLNKITEMKEKTKECIKVRLEESTDGKKLKWNETTMNTIIQIIDLNEQNFETTTQAKGIITEDLISKFRQHKDMKHKPSDYLLLILDCWLSTFYETIWKQRNDQTFDKATRQNMRNRRKDVDKRRKKQPTGKTNTRNTKIIALRLPENPTRETARSDSPTDLESVWAKWKQPTIC